MTAVAIAIHFAEDGQSAFTITGTLIAAAVAQIFVAPVLAPVFDKHTPNALITIAAAIDIATLLVLTIWPKPIILIAGTFLSASTTCIIIPAVFTLAENLSRSRAAETFANLDTARLLGSFIGPTLGGALVHVGTVRYAFIAEILASALTILIINVLPLVPVQKRESEVKEESFFARLIAAPVLLLRNRKTRAGLSSIWGAIIFTSIYNVALVFFAVDTLKVGGIGYALLMQAFIIGRLIGARFSARITESAAYQVLLLSGIIMGAMIASAGLVPNLFVAIIAFLCAGICNALQIAALRLLIYNAVEESIRPKALSTMGTVNTSAMFIGYCVGAPAVAYFGPALSLVISGVGTLVITLISAVFSRLTTTSQ
ncbi:MFS transporter [Corynebacterium felinum]|uniref:MFS transporter n=1 Tax=Corynebacterium felinum TaxID=131318 RepID=UPI0023F649AD|nr:MFS transporter [Corynebacterium felinum]MDF5819946.1 MFS transporter [Corynebacterium felinum]